MDRVFTVVPPPRSEQELQQRVITIAGMTMAQLAQQCGVATPMNLMSNKGWIGQLLEAALGADAQSRPEPDFSALSIELKTIPVRSDGYPLESTYVCKVPMFGEDCGSWQQSWVARKLSRVLWIPVEGDRSVELSQRRIGMGFIWTPNQMQQQLLQQDWEELTEMIISGRLAAITARMGKVLQIRPKAANRRVSTSVINEDGDVVQLNPRGFYLRSRFTSEIIASHAMQSRY